MIPFHYEFHGMTPSSWTEDFLQQELLPLLVWAPKDSSMRFRADRYNDGLEGKLIIHSSGGAFVVEAKGDDLTGIVNVLKKRMKTKLNKWRETHHYHVKHAV